MSWQEVIESDEVRLMMGMHIADEGEVQLRVKAGESSKTDQQH